MRLAIVGAGISGLMAAYQLSDQHEVEVFEASTWVGGHTNTVEVDHDGSSLAVDTGFIVFNDRTYPNFVNLLTRLEVKSQPTSMSFSVRNDRSGLEYRGADLNGLFAQRRNLFRPRFLAMLNDIVRFNRQAMAIGDAGNDRLTVREFFHQHQYGQLFLKNYFLPMAASIWSCPTETVQEFPIQFIITFYRHHGLLSTKDRPQWRVIQGGSQTYVKSMISGFKDRIHLNSPVTQVERHSMGVRIHANRSIHEFDHVIFACHADQALRILGPSATPAEREILGFFPYQRNVALLHVDQRVLPRCRRAWASWNYLLPADGSQRAPVTYHMNGLQGFKAPREFCVTLDGEKYIDPTKVIREIEYEHPIYIAGRAAAARRHAELIGPNRTSFCGAYWGNGFHEDGVVSALAVCEKLRIIEDPVRRYAVGRDDE